MVKPWRPTPLFGGQTDVSLWNAVISWAGQPIALARPASVRFAAVDVPEPGLRGHRIGFGSALECLVVPIGFPFNVLFGADFDVDDLARLPAALAARLDDGVIAALWDVVPDARLPDPVILATGRIGDLAGPAGLSHLQWLSFEIDGLAEQGPARAEVLIGCPIAEAVRLVGGGAFAPRAVANGLGERLTVPLARHLGTISLSVAALAGWTPGDVIVLAERHPGIVVLAGLDRRWVFHADQRGFVLGEIETSRHPIGQTEEVSMSHPTSPGGLAVTVDFEIGRLVVPIGALTAWQPGTIVTFDPPVTATGVTVTLRVEGRDIGTGDLVSLDDRLAVRLTHLIGDAPA